MAIISQTALENDIRDWIKTWNEDPKPFIWTKNDACPLDKSVSISSTPLGKLLDVVRVTGNTLLHVEDDPGEIISIALDDKTGQALWRCCQTRPNNLLDELITCPRQTDDRWDRLPEAVEAQIQRAKGEPDA